MGLLLFQGEPSSPSPAPPGGGLLTVVVVAILIFLGVLIAAAVVTGMVVSLKRRDAAGARGQSWLDYGNFFIVAIGIVAVFLAFLIALLTNSTLFRDPAQLLAVLAALFGVIGTLVGTYFGVKAGSDAAQGAQDLASGVIAPGPPPIVSVWPVANATGVVRNTPVIVTFPTDMNPNTINTLTQSQSCN